MNAPDRIFDADEPAALFVPPHSMEAEQSVLGALLIDNTAFDRISDLVQDGDFYRHEHRLIFAASAALITACKQADVITVFDAMKAAGGDQAAAADLAYLNSLAQNVPSASNAKQYARLVRQRAVERALISAAHSADEIARGKESIEIKLDRIGTLFNSIERQQMRKAPVPLADLMVRAIDRYSEIAEGTAAPAWRTGIGPLDRILNGGMRPGKVYGIAARPSVGKSAAARAIGLNVALDGQSVLLLSQEMPLDEVADCVIAQLGRVNSEHLQTGRLDDAEWGGLSEAVERARTLPFHVDDDGGLTLGDIRAKARMVKGLNVLMLDYLQLSTSTLKNASTNDQVAEISKGLKQLAIQMGIAVVVLSQLNRDVEKRHDKEPQLSDLRDSGAIEQDLDAAVMLWTVKDLDDEASRRIVGWKVAKHRGGRKGKFTMEFDAPRYVWMETNYSLEPPTATERRGKHKGFDE